MRINRDSLVFRILLLACIVLHADPTPADGSADAWKVATPIFTYCNYKPPSPSAAVETAYGWPAGYDPTALTAAIAIQAVAGGFNTVWITDLSQLAIAEQYGLRAQLVISGHQPQNNLFFLPITNWPNASDVAAINALIDRFKASPAAYSYYIIDEPSAARFPQLAAIVSYLRQRDPGHLAYINLFPGDEVTSDLGVSDYRTYLTEFVDVVHPALLSYDSYNLFVGKDRSSYLENMQLVAQAASRAGIPFMAILQGSSMGAAARVPTANEMRFLVNSLLAFGAQGISFFNYWTPTGPAAGGIAPFPDGTPTSIYIALRTLSPTFKSVAARLQNLQWIGTYVKGYRAAALPRGVTQPPDNSAFEVTGLGDTKTYIIGAPLKGVLLGYFGIHCVQPACAKYVFIQNLDYTTSKSLRVAGPEPLSVFDASSGAWVATGHNYADVALEPGGGALIGVSSSGT